MKYGATIVAMSLALLVLGVSVNVALAQESSPIKVMDSANQQYERSEFADAAQQYQQLVDQGYQDAALFYNLGNAYLKNDDLGRAIVNYLRASELSPRDKDVQTNLSLARSQTIDQIETSGDSLISSISNFSQRWLTLGELGVISLILWTVSTVAIGTLLLSSNSSRKVTVRNATIIALTAMSISLLLFLAALNTDANDDTGVIVVTSVDVLSGPGTQYVTEFTIHSGAEVRLIDSREGWTRLALPGGEFQGWVPSTTLETVGQIAGG
jgi:tetratricopeptide (TPR) repeat protein